MKKAARRRSLFSAGARLRLFQPGFEIAFKALDVFQKLIELGKYFFFGEFLVNMNAPGGKMRAPLPVFLSSFGWMQGVDAITHHPKMFGYVLRAYGKLHIVPVAAIVDNLVKVIILGVPSA
ncbi:MAG: hypothetical protein ACOYI3_07790 [Christensenellales bacterium]